MKMHLFSSKCVVTTAALLVAAQSATSQSTDSLIDTLLKKGILTEQEAKQLRSEAAKAPSATPAPNDVRLFWKEGLNFQSADKKFTGKLGGRIQLDVAGFSEDDEVQAAAGEVAAGTEFRRARLSYEGEYASSIPAYFKLEVDFAEAEIAFKDVYLGLNKIPIVGKIQAGHFKEPSSLEGLMSSRFLTFMERALPVEAFWPERNTGLMIGNAVLDDRMTWALGTYTSSELRGGVDGGENMAGDWRGVGRLSGAPLYDAESKGRRLIHLGVSGTVAEPEGNEIRFRTRPEAHLAPRLVDTGDIEADRQYMAAAEAAAVFGPFSVQGEYFHNWVNGPDDSEFNGYYVYGSWFITGEHRAYRPSTGVFDRIMPKHNLSFSNGGLGAWEVALRYSSVDLDDAGGGTLDDITGGINWYLNPNMKIQFNYVYAMMDRTIGTVDHDGEAHVFQARLHVDF